MNRSSVLLLPHILLYTVINLPKKATTKDVESKVSDLTMCAGLLENALSKSKHVDMYHIWWCIKSYNVHEEYVSLFMCFWFE